MKAQHINAFLKAAIKVFKTMLDVQARREDVRLKQNKSTVHDVTGTVTIMGSLTGSVGIGVDEPVAMGIAGRFLGMTFKELDRDVIDAMGELTNMIVGSGKTDLVKSGVPADISVPQVVVGKGHRLWAPADLPCIQTMLDSDLGEFVMDIRVKESDA